MSIINFSLIYIMILSDVIYTLLTAMIWSFAGVSAKAYPNDAHRSGLSPSGIPIVIPPPF